MKNNDIENRKLVYVTDCFLDLYKSEFDTKFNPLYKNNDVNKLKEIFSLNDPSVLIETSIPFNYKKLIIDNGSEARFENVKTIYSSLRHLSIKEAENEKVWVGLSNTFYLDYHIFELNNASNDKGMKSRAFFTYNRKRSLMLNSLSLLWWIGHYTVDDRNDKNPFHLSEFLIRNTSRSDLMLITASNIVSNKEILLGTIEGVKELSETKGLKASRYAFTNSNKILNQIGGIRILDALSRNEIKEIVVDNLLDTDHIRVDNKL